MSQARHAMGGPNRVSSLQYDSVMSSLVNIQVDTNPLPGDGPDTSDQDQGESVEFHLEWKTPAGKGSGESKTTDDEGTTVRRRKGEEESIEEVPREKTEGGGSNDSEDNNKLLKDPLIWLGVLVPSTLRRSQQLFKQG